MDYANLSDEELMKLANGGKMPKKNYELMSDEDLIKLTGTVGVVSSDTNNNVDNIDNSSDNEFDKLWDESNPDNNSFNKYLNNAKGFVDNGLHQVGRNLKYGAKKVINPIKNRVNNYFTTLKDTPEYTNLPTQPFTQEQTIPNESLGEVEEIPGALQGYANVNQKINPVAFWANTIGMNDEEKNIIKDMLNNPKTVPAKMWTEKDYLTINKNLENYYNKLQKKVNNRELDINTANAMLKAEQDKTIALLNQYESDNKKYNLYNAYLQNSDINNLGGLVKSIPVAGKEFTKRAIRSVPEFGKGMADLVALAGDTAQGTGLNALKEANGDKVKSLKGSLAYLYGLGLGYTGRKSNELLNKFENILPQPNEQYQHATGLANLGKVLPTVAGTIGDQATNIATSIAGGGIAANAAKKAALSPMAAKALTTAAIATPNIVQEGTYLDKLSEFERIYGRKPTDEEAEKIRQVAFGEKTVNTAIETISDVALFNKIFPDNPVSKNIKNVIKKGAEQAVTEGLTETAQEGSSILAEKALGINQGDNKSRLGEAGILGSVTGGLMGGAGHLLSKNNNEKTKEPQTTDFTLGETGELKTPERPQPKTEPKVEYPVSNVAEEIKDIAPNIAAKQGQQKQAYTNFVNTHLSKNLVDKTPEKWNGKTIEEAKAYLGFGDKNFAEVKSPIENIKIYEQHLEHLINDNEPHRRTLLNRTLETIKNPNIITKEGNYHKYVKLFQDDKVKPHLQIVKVKDDGSFYVTNFKPSKGQVQKILEGQVIYDLSSLSDTKSIDNNIIADNTNNFNEIKKITPSIAAKQANKKNANNVVENKTENKPVVTENAISENVPKKNNITSEIENIAPNTVAKQKAPTTKNVGNYTVDVGSRVNYRGFNKEQRKNIAEQILSQYEGDLYPDIKTNDILNEAVNKKIDEDEYFKSLGVNERINISVPGTKVKYSIRKTPDSIRNFFDRMGIKLSENNAAIEKYTNKKNPTYNFKAFVYDGDYISEGNFAVKPELVNIKNKDTLDILQNNKKTDHNIKALFPDDNDLSEIKDRNEIFTKPNKVKVRIFETADGNKIYLDNDFAKIFDNYKLYATQNKNQPIVAKNAEGENVGLIMPYVNQTEPTDVMPYKKIKEENNNTENNKHKTEVEQVAPKTVEKRINKKEDNNKKLEDVGEFLKGNRKENTNLTWEDLEGMNELVREKNLTKAKIYKKPTFEEFEAQGLSKYQAAVATFIYNHIAAKAPYKNLKNQKTYVENIKPIMDKVVETIKNNPDDFDFDFEKYTFYAGKNGWVAKKTNKLFDAIFPDVENKKATNPYKSIFSLYPEYNELALIMGGDRFVKALQISKSDTKAIEKIWESFNNDNKKSNSVKKEDWEKNFTILEPDKWNNKWQIGTAKKINGGHRIIGDKFDTKEEAVEFAKKLTEMQNKAQSELKKANFEREYVERRKNNVDITPDELRETFGFKGVNFGNYVKQDERQQFLNYAYDSLYDLSELLNLPVKALSLNGNLGLAFGAQGRGGQAAGHYIPDYQEINMTKDKGAGTLAHEWWHAFDNYIGYKSEGKEVSQSFGTNITKQGELRKEVFDDFRNLYDVIKNAPLSEEEITKNKQAIIDRCERNIKYYASEIKNLFGKVEGVNEFVDNLVANKDKYIHMTDEELHNIEWNEFGKLIPEKRKTITNMAKMNWLLGEIQRIGRVDELTQNAKGKTEFYKSAERLNEIEKMGKGYWTEPTELGARAFTSYLLDKMETQQIVNKFLARSQAGEVSFDFRELAKELKDGEERNFKVYWNPQNAEEKAKIFAAFDKLFDTIKTRETDKGVEIYTDLPFGDVQPDVSGNKELPIKIIYKAVKKNVTGKDLANLLPIELANIVNDVAGDYTFKNLITSKEGLNGTHSFEKKTIKLNLDAIDDNPYKFVETLIHEVRHAWQYKQKAVIMNKLSKGETLTQEEKDFLIKIKNIKKVNAIKNKFYRKYKSILDKHFKNLSKLKTEEEIGEYFKNLAKNKPSIYNIVKKYKNLFSKYYNDELETDSRDIGGRYAKEYIYRNTREKRKPSILRRIRSTFIRDTQWNNRTGTRDSSEYSESFGRGRLKNQKQSTNNTTKKGTNDDDDNTIEKTTKDLIYDWHGKIGKNRYDVDKAINSFNNMSKVIAKELSDKKGIDITGKQLREILPFLRERTAIPDKLDRVDLKKIYNKLSSSDKDRLTKFADDMSAKFEKYYKEYQETKGIESDERIENHISHIWDLDKKHKSLMTNYFTTNSKFAKQRTIKSLMEGINGIDINGETVYFKPKTLDYSEILKTSSDNLIKAAADSELAFAVKNLTHNGEKLVLPASKAPSDWIEINHPAINKAVYMGEVGENELPMIMKTPVKVHPAAARYLEAVFEQQKADNFFWKVYDTINGVIKQVTLSASGFHPVALIESALGNAFIKTLRETANLKKYYDGIVKNEFSIYSDKNEEIVKQAIEDGLQLGTPQSDTNRNLVDELLSKNKIVNNTIGTAIRVNNTILWDIIHNDLKLMAYKTHIEKLGHTATKEERREIAQWVNDSFGGQAWELLGIKPSTVKTLSRVLLSPDWNISVIRQAAGAANSKLLEQVVNNTPALRRFAETLGISGIHSSEGTRGKIARGFWMRAILISMIGLNTLNAMNREKDRKEHPELYPEKMQPIDYTIWSNANPNDPLANKINPYVFIGRNDKGQELYARFGKQFREVPEMVTKPQEKLAGKTAANINLACQIYLGYSPADISKMIQNKPEDVYFNSDIWNGTGKYAKKKEGLDLAFGRGKTLVKGIAPFIMQNALNEQHDFNPYDLAVQTSKGLTFRKTKEQIYKSLLKNNKKDIEKIKLNAHRAGMSNENIENARIAAEKAFKQDYKDKYKQAFLSNEKTKDDINKIDRELQNKGYSRDFIEEIKKKPREKAKEKFLDEYVEAINSGDRKNITKLTKELRKKGLITKEEIELIYKKALKKTKE